MVLLLREYRIGLNGRFGFGRILRVWLLSLVDIPYYPVVPGIRGMAPTPDFVLRTVLVYNISNATLRYAMHAAVILKHLELPYRPGFKVLPCCVQS
jgi:hypothetical protein